MSESADGDLQTPSGSDLRNTMQGLDLNDPTSQPVVTSTNPTTNTTVSGEYAATVTPSVDNPAQQGGESSNSMQQSAMTNASLLNQHLSPSPLYYHHGTQYQPAYHPWYMPAANGYQANTVPPPGNHMLQGYGTPHGGTAQWGHNLFISPVGMQALSPAPLMVPQQWPPAGVQTIAGLSASSGPSMAPTQATITGPSPSVQSASTSVVQPSERHSSAASGSTDLSQHHVFVNTSQVTGDSQPTTPAGREAGPSSGPQQPTMIMSTDPMRRHLVDYYTSMYVPDPSPVRLSSTSDGAALAQAVATAYIPTPTLKGTTVKHRNDFMNEVRAYRLKGGVMPLQHILTEAQLHHYVVSADIMYPQANHSFNIHNISEETIMLLMKAEVRPRNDQDFNKEIRSFKMSEGVGESVQQDLTDYYSKYYNLINLYGTMQQLTALLGVTDTVVADTFCKGLAANIRQPVLDKRHKSLTDAYHDALARANHLDQALTTGRAAGYRWTYEPRQSSNHSDSNSFEKRQRTGQSSQSEYRPMQSSQSNASAPQRANKQSSAPAAKTSGKPTCKYCGIPGHTEDVCRKKAREQGNQAQGSSAAKATKHPQPSTSGTGKQRIRCKRVLFDDLDNDFCSDTEIAECQGSVAAAHDVTFASGRNITINLDTCSSHTLISLSLCREMNIQLPESETLEVEAWDGSRVYKDVYLVELCFKINNSPKFKPYVFKLKCFAVDMVTDMIMCNRDLKSFRIPQYLTATETNFPYTHTWETSPEEEQEDDYGMESDFPNLSSLPTTTEYTIDEYFSDQERLHALLTAYERVFTPSDAPMHTDEFFIDLIEGAEVPRQWPRNTPPSIQEEIDKEVERWLAEGICRPSLSSVASPVVAARKPDGSLRLCIDYQKLNKWTVPMSHPLPRVADRLKSLQGKKIFAKMDLRWGFHQLAVREDSKHLTAFCTKKGLYEFNRLPFGLKNASSFFQAKVEEILIGIAGTVLVFIDDLVVAADTEEEFLRTLEEVLQRLSNAGVVLKASKCTFGADKVEYLGYVVDALGIRLTDKRIQAVSEYPVPKNSQAVRRFLGVTNAFRDSISNYAKLVEPLQRLTKKGITYEWKSEHDEAFTSLRSQIANHATLHHLTYEHPIVLRTDASIEGVGAVLFQIRDGKEEPILFLSQRFSGAATRWSTIEQEAYAIFWAVMKLESYLLGHYFHIETDHRNLLYMSDATAPKVVRWRLRLQEYDFQVIHIPGKTNVIADALSRCYRVRARTTPAMTPIVRFRACHNAVCGHNGRQRTKQLLRQSGMIWETASEAELDRQIQQFIDDCVTCQKHRQEQRDMNPALASTLRYEPFECVAFDTMGPFEEDVDGNKYIIVGIDLFTRTVELTARKDATAKSAAASILEWTGRYGAPREIQSDNGTQFVNSTIEELLKFIQSTHRLTLPYRPQANGVVERSNREILKHLRAIVFDNRLKSQWSSVLPMVQRIMNSQIHSATGASPIRLLYGDAVTVNRGLLTEWSANTDTTALDTSEYLTVLNQQLQDIVSASQQYQRTVETRRLSKSPVNPTTFRVGQYVLVRYPNGPPDKLTPFWKGPMLVTKVENQTYWCQDLLSGRQTPLFVDRLKAFTPSDQISNEDAAVADNDDFIVEKFLAHKGNAKVRATLQFKVKWLGYPLANDETDWIPWSQAKKNVLIDSYLQSKKPLRYLLKERNRE